MSQSILHNGNYIYYTHYNRVGPFFKAYFAHLKFEFMVITIYMLKLPKIEVKLVEKIQCFKSYSMFEHNLSKSYNIPYNIIQLVLPNLNIDNII